LFTYSIGLNVLAAGVASWSAILYAAFTRDWVGTALWLTLGFAALTAKRLTPHRDEPDAE
jgi:hypothetical protein